MKKSFSLVLAIFVLGALVLSACGGGASEAEYPSPPAEYEGKTNPLSGDSAAISAGQELYDARCASCHGVNALGDGPAGSALDPAPSNLVNTSNEASDAYIYWRIAEGGAMDPFNSSMPANKNTMTEDEIWQVISYIESLQ